mgnify:CR=1 FL=1
MKNLEERVNKKEFNWSNPNKKFINKFCKKYDLLLTKITTTYETGKPKNMYSFNNDLSGYTLDGIKKSLY